MRDTWFARDNNIKSDPSKRNLQQHRRGKIEFESNGNGCNFHNSICPGDEHVLGVEHKKKRRSVCDEKMASFRDASRTHSQ